MSLSQTELIKIFLSPMNVNAKMEKRQLFVDHLLRGDITAESPGNELAAMLGVSPSAANSWRNFFFGYKTRAELSYENFVRRLENDLPFLRTETTRDDAMKIVSRENVQPYIRSTLHTLVRRDGARGKRNSLRKSPNTSELLALHMKTQ